MPKHQDSVIRRIQITSALRLECEQSGGRRMVRFVETPGGSEGNTLSLTYDILRDIYQSADQFFFPSPGGAQ